MINNEASIPGLVAQRIGANRFRTWLGERAEFVLRERGMDVIVPNAFVCNWVANNFMADMLAVAQQVLGPDITPEVRILHHDASAAPSAPATAAKRPSARPVRRRAPLRGTLDNFVVGACNRLAYSAALNIVREPGGAFRQLLIHGGCGLGKTHLLQGVCNGIRTQHPTIEWRYVSGEEFTNEYIRALRDHRIEAFRERFRGVGILVIDDIHFLANKKATQEEFMHTFDAIDACGRGVILSSDRHPRSIGTLSDPLMNRLMAGMIVSVEPPDRETRVEILERRAKAMGLPITAEAVQHIADTITRNVRELEGALLKLRILASLSPGPIDLLTARRAIDELTDRRPAPAVADIARRAAIFFGVTREQIYSRSRDRTVSLARGFAMHLARTQTALSYPEIGRVMGAKNHSTVLMAHQRIERALQENAILTWKAAGVRREARAREVLERLLGELNSG